MKRGIILFLLIMVIIIISFSIIQIFLKQKEDKNSLNQSMDLEDKNSLNQSMDLEDKNSLNQSMDSFYSKPMNISILMLNREFQINAPSSPEAIAWESMCSTDEDCKYAQNYGEGLCINLDHTSDPSYFNIDESISCVCKPLVIESPTTDENINVWVEDQGSIICQIEEDKADLSILNFEITPENPEIEERVIYNTTIKNVGSSGCSMVDTIVNFGDGSSGGIRMNWCTHYWTPEYCEQKGYELYFNPNEIINPSTYWYYNITGAYNVTVVTMCFEPELKYDNNNANKFIHVA